MKKEPEIEKIYSLSPMQEGMLFHYLKDEKSTAYSEQRLFTLEGEIDPALLENSIRYLVERYDVFRTVFQYQKSKQPLQIVFKERKFNLQLEDISQMPAPAKEKRLEDIKNNDLQKGFDFRKDLLIRVFLFKTGIDTWKLLWSFHHIIMDGWCLGIIFKELIQVYNSLRRGKPVRLKPAVPYREYIRWLKKQDPDKGLSYWREYLDGYHWQAGLAGPVDRKECGEYRLKEYTFIIPGNLKERMNLRAVEEESTLFTLLQTAWGILLQKYNNTDDVVFGTVVSGRSPEIEGIGDMVGLFVNTIPLRIQTKEKQDFQQLLKQVNREILSTRSYEYLPLAEVQACSPLKGRLIDHIIVYENYPLPGDTGQNHTGSAPGFRVIHMKSHEQTSYDLNILVIPGTDLTIIFNYNGSVYESDFLEKTANRFLNLLNEVTVNPNREISKIEITSAEEKKQLLLDFNHTRTQYPGDKTIHTLFAEQAQQTPDHIAAVGVHGIPCSEGTGGLAPLPVLMSITYKELNEKSRQLAHALKEQGVKPDTAAGIMVERSLDMIIGILGILKAGGAYLPIDPECPQDRIEYLLKDSGAPVLLTVHAIEEAINKSYRSYRSYLPATGHWSPPASLAYILYTSGSTGKPKGVMVEHRNVVRLVKNTNYIRFQPGQRLLQTGPLEFDASTFEIWGPLLNGAILYEIPRRELLMPRTLGMRVRSFGIDTMWMTAPLFNQVVDADIEIFTGIKNLLVGGDTLSPPHIDRIKRRFPRLNVIDGYGPTENTTFSTTFLIHRKYKKNIPIGKPIANSTAYILDRNFNLQPIGIVGDLVVGGDGVSRGYLNDPELTAKKFLPVSSRYYRSHMSYRSYISPKIYLTGDLARWLPDGNIRFLGRKDHQVKIRGVRIELGEIENHLRNHKEIEEAVVLVKKNKAAGKYLCAYIVSKRNFNVSQLKEYLSARLPGNMVPSIFVQIDKIPLTANGKIDRKLLDLQGRRIITGIEYAAPQNETEKIIAGTWKQILNLDKVGRHDNFFDLGGDSLRVMTLAAKIHKELDVEIPLTEFFNRPTIKALTEYIHHTGRKEYITIKPVEKRDYYPQSSAQKRLFFLDQFEEISTSYNIPFIFKVEGSLDRDRLENAINASINRHESLRTSFHMEGNEAVQRVHEKVEFQIEYNDTDKAQVGDFEGTRGLAPLLSTYLSSVIRHLSSGFIRPFDLSRPPLLHFGLISLGTDEYLLLFDMHHIISDGTSMGVLLDDFTGLYEGEALPSLKIQFKDFALWQNHLFETGKIKEQEDYWLNLYSDANEIPGLNLPLDYDSRRPPVFTFKGDTYGFKLENEDALRFKTLCSQDDATLFMNLLAVLNLLLYKYTGQEDMIVGCSIAGRSHADLQRIIGMFVNELAVRNYPGGEKCYREFLKEVKAASLQAYENQDMQFEELVDRLNLDRIPSRNPLFDVCLSVTNFQRPARKMKGVSVVPWNYKNKTSKFDLTLFAGETAEGIHFGLEYCTSLFKKETIEKMAGHFINIIRQVTMNPGIRLSGIDILSEEERKRLVVDFNRTGTAYPEDKTIHELFAEQAARTPGNIAAAGQDPGAPFIGAPSRGQAVHITYKELNEGANRLAGYLAGEKGIGIEDRVGIMMNNSIDLIIAILGVLKAGGAYIPLEPSWPQHRIKSILEDAGAGMVIENGLTRRRYNDNGRFTPRARPDHIAYIIYTSGTTGKPKGVIIQHRGLVNYVCWAAKQYLPDKAGTCVFPLYTPLSFDLTVTSIFVPLISGNTTAVYSSDDDHNRFPILDIIKSNTVDLVKASPSHLKLIQNEIPSKNSRIKTFIVGGEELESTLAHDIHNRFPGNVNIYNEYGPTEAAVGCMIHEFAPGRDTRKGVPIGLPVDNVKVYILDRDLNPVPGKAVGELCIAGDCLARGYLNRPELTSEKFCLRRPGGTLFEGTRGLAPLLSKVPGSRIYTPLLSKVPGSRIYRSYRSHRSYLYHTGDLARWLPTGNIEFIGRVDHQVKIRGFRIELGEIENRLLNHEAVKEAVVTAREEENQDKYLCAYTVLNREIARRELREYLAGDLPGYMIPAYFVFLEKIPLTPNGKIDRKRLPAPGLKGIEEYTAPRTPVEKKLTGIWAEVLGIEKNLIGIDHNFFDLGGHSLKATILISRIHKKLDTKLSLERVFKFPTIRELSVCLAAAARERFSPITAIEKKEFYQLTFNQKRLWYIQQKTPKTTSYHMGEVISLDHAVDIEALQSALKKLFARHESLRTGFAEIKGKPMQFVLEMEDKDLPLRVRDVSALEAEEQKRRTAQIIAEVTDPPFDLRKPSLFRAALIKQHTENYLLVYNMHHIISDGWSMEILKKDFNRYYRDYANGKEPLREPLLLQYKDFARWHNEQIRDPGYKDRVYKYWKKKLETGFPLLQLTHHYHSHYTGDNRRNDSAGGGWYRCAANRTLKERLHQLAKKNQTSLFMVLFSIYNLLMAFLSGQDEVVSIVISAGRQHDSLHPIVGYFINPIIIKTHITLREDFENLLSRINREVLEILQHQEYPLELVLDDMKKEFPRVGISFNMLNVQDISTETELDSLTSHHNNIHKEMKFDIALSVLEYKNGIEFSWGYRRMIFNPQTMENFAQKYLELIEDLTLEDESKTGEIK